MNALKRHWAMYKIGYIGWFIICVFCLLLGCLASTNTKKQEKVMPKFVTDNISEIDPHPFILYDSAGWGYVVEYSKSKSDIQTIVYTIKPNGK